MVHQLFHYHVIHELNTSHSCHHILEFSYSFQIKRKIHLTDEGVWWMCNGWREFTEWEAKGRIENLREENRIVFLLFSRVDCLLQLPLNIGIMEMSWILVYSVYIIETVRIKRQAWVMHVNETVCVVVTEF
jgi:hypothetical protein